MKKQTKNKSAFSAQHPAPSALNYLRCKVKKSASYVLHFILIALMVVSLNSCKRDISEQINETKFTNKPGLNHTQSSNNFNLLDSLSLLSISILQAMSELEQNDLCTLIQIINSEDNYEEKINAISNNAALGGVYQSLIIIGNYTEANDISQFSGDIIAQQYLAERFLSELEIDVYAPNNDPCSLYKSSLSLCASSFAACILSSVFLPQPAGFCLALICSHNAIECINLAKATYPMCADPTSRFSVLIDPLITKINNC